MGGWKGRVDGGVDGRWTRRVEREGGREGAWP